MSPVIATTILLAVTVVLGLALWSYANSGVGSATKSYADVVTNYGRFTSDTFIVPTIAYDYPATGDLDVWVYNSGSFDTTIQSVIVSCKVCTVQISPETLDQSSLISGDMVVASKTLKELKFNTNTTFNVGDTYQVQVISTTQAYQTTFQKY